MRLRVLAAVLIGSSAMVLALAGPSTAGGGDLAAGPIVVAVEAPLSGSQQANGRDMLRGVRLAARQVNARGGVLGRRIQVLPVDDQADPKRAARAVEEAAGGGAVAVIGPYNSSVAVRNLPLYLERGIVPVHMSSTNDTDGQGVTVQPKNDQISPTEVAYVRASGASSVVMLVDPSLYTQGMADRLAAGLAGQGVAVTRIAIAEGKDDYNAEVARALESSPDLVYVSTYYPEGAKIATALQASGAGDPMCLMGLANVDPAFVAETTIDAAQRCAFSGVPAAAQLPGARAKRFVQDYRRAFDREPGVWGVFTYDSANLLFAAMQQSGSTGFARVLDELQRTSGFKGATGEISIDARTGNREVVPVYILSVDDTGDFIVTGRP